MLSNNVLLAFFFFFFEAGSRCLAEDACSASLAHPHLHLLLHKTCP